LTEITLTESDRLDWAIKTFRRKVQRAGILMDLKKKRHYNKPSVAKRLKAAAARRRRRKQGRARS
jgi:small subunit ribosomal protein S21